jgi:hypothetical protein
MIGNVVVVDLSNCKVDDRKLMLDSKESDDEGSSNLSGCIYNSEVGVIVGAKTLLPQVAPAVVAEDAALPSGSTRTSIDSNLDPLLNAIGKTTLVDAVVVKQEAR